MAKIPLNEVGELTEEEQKKLLKDAKAPEPVVTERRQLNG